MANPIQSPKQPEPQEAAPAKRHEKHGKKKRAPQVEAPAPPVHHHHFQRPIEPGEDESDDLTS